MRAAVLSAQRLQRNVSCDVTPSSSSSSSSSSPVSSESSSLNDALQRADKTRFIAAASQSIDRQFTAAWLQRMVDYHHSAQSDTAGQRGSKWGRPTLIPAVIGNPLIIFVIYFFTPKAPSSIGLKY